MRFLKVFNESESRIKFSSFDHRTGPRYDRLCLLYATVLNLGIMKSEFLNYNEYLKQRAGFPCFK